MDTGWVSTGRMVVTRLGRSVKAFAASEVGSRAVGLFVFLIALLFAINGLNVVNSYVNRNFMTAIADRNMGGFVYQAMLYIGVFAASTVTAVLYGFSEGRLGLLWRAWLTRRLVGFYLEHPISYRLADHLVANGEIANPDQRIAEDVRSFTATTLSFALMLLNGTFTVVAFSGVLWSISPVLFGVAVAYAAFGSLLTVVLGRPLVGLNYRQFDREAYFRASLVHVRENAESIALLGREGRLKARLLRQLDDLVANYRQIIAVSRNLGFFTTGYNYLTQIIPALIVAPLFIRGHVEFGVITQSAIAFSQLLGAFSLIINQFQSISSFAAVVARLGSLADAIERARSAPALAVEVCSHHRRRSTCPICIEREAATAAVELCETDGRIVYERLTLRSAESGEALLKELSVTVPSGTRVLIAGPNEAARAALFRATAGVWDAGDGRIVRPTRDEVFFLPQRPYLVPGTLREVIVRAGCEREVSDERILGELRTLGLDVLVTRFGGLDTEHDWDNLLSLGEQQLFNIARLLIAAPRFALLDRLGTTLAREQIDRFLTLLSERSITYLVFEAADERRERYEAVLEIATDGTWTWQPTATGAAGREGAPADR